MCSLIVDCSGFPLEFCTYLTDTVGQIQQVKSIPASEIAGYAYTSGVNAIYLQGPEEYCFGLKEEIANQLVTEYSNKHIEIEVM